MFVNFVLSLAMNLIENGYPEIWFFFFFLLFSPSNYTNQTDGKEFSL